MSLLVAVAGRPSASPGPAQADPQGVAADLVALLICTHTTFCNRRSRPVTELLDVQGGRQRLVGDGAAVLVDSCQQHAVGSEPQCYAVADVESSRLASVLNQPHDVAR